MQGARAIKMNPHQYLSLVTGYDEWKLKIDEFGGIYIVTYVYVANLRQRDIDNDANVPHAIGWPSWMMQQEGETHNKAMGEVPYSFCASLASPTHSGFGLTLSSKNKECQIRLKVLIKFRELAEIATFGFVSVYTPGSNYLSSQSGTVLRCAYDVTCPAIRQSVNQSVTHALRNAFIRGICNVTGIPVALRNISTQAQTTVNGENKDVRDNREVVSWPRSEPKYCSPTLMFELTAIFEQLMVLVVKNWGQSLNV